MGGTSFSTTIKPVPGMTTPYLATELKPPTAAAPSMGAYGVPTVTGYSGFSGNPITSINYAQTTSSSPFGAAPMMQAPQAPAVDYNAMMSAISGSLGLGAQEPSPAVGGGSAALGAKFGFLPVQGIRRQT